jgi:hypothetical protein
MELFSERSNATKNFHVGALGFSVDLDKCIDLLVAERCRLHDDYSAKFCDGSDDAAGSRYQPDGV